jgi:hypothetical protein
LRLIIAVSELEKYAEAKISKPKEMSNIIKLGSSVLI